MKPERKNKKLKKMKFTEKKPLVVNKTRLNCLKNNKNTKDLCVLTTRRVYNSVEFEKKKQTNIKDAGFLHNEW